MYFKKDWYGANFDVDYFNIKYNVNHIYLPFEFIIPDYLKGVILKLGTNIYPIDGNIFSLELNGGLYHTILSNRLCNSVTFLTTGELLEKHYIVNKISTTNFYYGATMIFRVYKNFSLTANMEFYNGDEFNIISSGISIRYEFK